MSAVCIAHSPGDFCLVMTSLVDLLITLTKCMIISAASCKMLLVYFCFKQLSFAHHSVRPKNSSTFEHIWLLQFQKEYFKTWYLIFRTGYCKPLKKEGEFCVPFGKEMSFFNTKAHFASCPCADDMYCASDKEVTQHETFGHMETHTNAICAKPEVEGSGEEME